MIKYRFTINKKLFFWLIFAHSKKSIPKLQRQSRPAKDSTPCDKYPYVMTAVSPTIGLNLCLYPFPLTMAMPLILCLITPNASSSWLDGWIERAAEESLLSPRLEVIAIGRCVWGGPGSEIQFCAEIKLAKRLEIQVFGTHLKKVTNVRPRQLRKVMQVPVRSHFSWSCQIGDKQHTPSWESKVVARSPRRMSSVQLEWSGVLWAEQNEFLRAVQLLISIVWNIRLYPGNDDTNTGHQNGGGYGNRTDHR